MFLGLPDPDPLVRGMDPDPDPGGLKTCGSGFGSGTLPKAKAINRT